MTEVLNRETGELTQKAEPEPDPIGEPEPDPTPESEPEGRCEAVTTVGGTEYRCALEGQHEGEHAFTQLEDEPPSAQAQAKDQEKAIQKLSAEALRHRNRLAEIMGEDVGLLIPCELCAPNLAGWRFEGSPTEDTIQAVRQVIGLPDLTNYAPSHWETTCDNCRGLGKVRTGSTVGRHEILDCEACKGKGYITTRERTATPQSTSPIGQPENGEQPVYDDGVRRDMFGTPEGDPDYEKAPPYRQRPTDYWLQNRT